MSERGKAIQLNKLDDQPFESHQCVRLALSLLAHSDCDESG